jgi:hypothetical protein
MLTRARLVASLVNPNPAELHRSEKIVPMSYLKWNSGRLRNATRSNGESLAARKDYLSQTAAL